MPVKAISEMSQISVSVIVPFYHVEQYLLRCLQSVGMQTYDGWVECILVDDQSLDGCVAIAEEFIANYHGRVKFTLLHHQINRGLSAARNTGLERATCDYVFFLDSDDYISADCIEHLVAPLTEKSYDLVMGQYVKVKNGSEQPCHTKIRRGAYGFQDDLLGKYFRNEWDVTACNKLYNRDFLRANSLEFKEGMLHEDGLWSFQVAKSMNCMYVCDAPTYYYYIRENSIQTSRHNGQAHVDSMLQICRAMVEDYLSRDVPPNNYLSYLFGYAQIVFDNAVWMGADNRKAYHDLRTVLMSLLPSVNGECGFSIYMNSLPFRLHPSVGQRLCKLVYLVHHVRSNAKSFAKMLLQKSIAKKI